MRRLHQWLFTGGFLAVIAMVPLSQAGLEIARGRRPQSLDVFTQPATQANLRAYERGLEDSSVWAKAVRPYVQSIWFRLLGDAGEKAVVGRAGWLFYKPDLRYLVEPPGEAAGAIIGFRDQLARLGIRLLVLPVPGKPAVYPEMLPWRIHNGPVRSHTLDLIGKLRRSGVEVVDLFGLFGQLRKGGETLYLLRDTHWSGTAARKSAEVVARRVRELGWIEPGDVDYATRALAVKRQSDIARMIRVAGIEGAYPPEVVRCEQVIRPATGELYRDDPDSPVLILGDSFLRMYQTDAPHAAGFIAHLARELKRPVTSVVNDGGASTLVRQELSRRPQLLRGKRVVIWEFVERDISYGAEGWQPVPLPGDLREIAGQSGAAR
jgi:hypothetical protein